MVSGLIVGVVLILSPDGGGFLTGLGKALGFMTIGAACLVSLICNMLCWFSGWRPRWLIPVAAAQLLPALAFGGFASWFTLSEESE